MNDDEKVQDIAKKIEREKALINAANLMRQQTNNEAVRSKLDTQMREGRRNLEFFENRMREIQMRRGMETVSVSSSTPSGSNRDSGYRGGDAPPQPPPKDASGYGDRSGYGHGHSPSGDLMPSHGPFPGQPPNAPMPKSRPNFTKLGMTR